VKSHTLFCVWGKLCVCVCVCVCESVCVVRNLLFCCRVVSFPKWSSLPVSQPSCELSVAESTLLGGLGDSSGW
jgi:hypothetical protein